IKHGAASEDPFFWVAGNFEGGVGEDVNRICHDQQDSFKISLCDFGNDGFENSYILVDEIQSCLTGFLVDARCDDNQRTVADVVVTSGVNCHKRSKRPAVSQINGFDFCIGMVGIDQNQL